MNQGTKSTLSMNITAITIINSTRLKPRTLRPSFPPKPQKSRQAQPPHNVAHTDPRGGDGPHIRIQTRGQEKAAAREQPVQHRGRREDPELAAVAGDADQRSQHQYVAQHVSDQKSYVLRLPAVLDSNASDLKVLDEIPA